MESTGETITRPAGTVNPVFADMSLLRENVRFNCSGKMSAILEV